MELKGKEFWGIMENTFVLAAITPKNQIIVRNKSINKTYYVNKYQFLNWYIFPIKATIIHDTIKKGNRIIPYKYYYTYNYYKKDL